MKPNEPSRTALVAARQRSAHQVLDHGSILDDPFAMKILGEDEKDVLQFASEHPYVLTTLGPDSDPVLAGARNVFFGCAP
jgi:O-methyltransferase involved in polyketide biosynthesis